MCGQHKFWTPRRSDRAHVAEHARDDDSDEEDEIVVLRDTGRGAKSRNEAVAARVGPARTPPRPTSALEWQAIRDGPAAPASPGATVTSTASNRTRQACCATRAEARRRGTS